MLCPKNVPLCWLQHNHVLSRPSPQGHPLPDVFIHTRSLWSIYTKAKTSCPVHLHRDHHMLSCPPTPRSPASCHVDLRQSQILPVMSIYTKVSHFLSCPSTLRSSIHFMSRPSTPRSPTRFLSCPSTLRSSTSCPVYLHQGQPLPVMSIYTKVIHFISRLLHQGPPLSVPPIYTKVRHFLFRPSTSRSATFCSAHLHQSQPLPVLSSHTQGLQIRSKAAGRP